MCNGPWNIWAVNIELELEKEALMAVVGRRKGEGAIDQLIEAQHGGGQGCSGFRVVNRHVRGEHFHF